eukprot:494580-Prorocentrum_minimum.AAC.2
MQAADAALEGEARVGQWRGPPRRPRLLSRHAADWAEGSREGGGRAHRAAPTGPRAGGSPATRDER